MHQERGVKRLCAACGTRYFDLMAKPVCPKCQTEFVIPPPAPPRRGVRNGYAFRPASLAEAEPREEEQKAEGEEQAEEVAELE